MFWNEVDSHTDACALCDNCLLRDVCSTNTKCKAVQMFFDLSRLISLLMNTPYAGSRPHEGRFVLKNKQTKWNSNETPVGGF